MSDPIAQVASEPALERQEVVVSCAPTEPGARDPHAPHAKTTLSGTVFDPAGAVPLPNVVVYVPGSSGESLPAISITDPEPINALVRTTTDARGEFVLEGVPEMKALPLVVQRGKWRRRVFLNATTRCENYRADDGMLRLPRNGREGDLPHLAVSTGDCDAYECLLRGMGVDDREFVIGDDMTGHVHLFKGAGGRMGADAETQLWNDAANLRKYDAVLLNCECAEQMANKRGSAPEAMHTYLDGGGRVLAGHYQYGWFKESPYADFQQIASWSDREPPTDRNYDLVTSFPDGLVFSQWLTNAGAATNGQIQLVAGRSSTSVLSTLVQPWIQQSAQPPILFTFDTPLGAPKERLRGRVAFSDLHVMEAPGQRSSIAACPISPGGLDPAQRALEYTVFGLTSALGH